MRLPYYTVITDKVKYGDSKLCRVRLNPAYADDKGLIAHEEKHIEQWYKSLLVVLFVCAGLWAGGRADIAFIVGALGLSAKDLLYTFWPWFRLKMEVQAYKAQLQVSDRPENLHAFAHAIANSYDLNITTNEAKKLLQGA